MRSHMQGNVENDEMDEYRRRLIVAFFDGGRIYGIGKWAPFRFDGWKEKLLFGGLVFQQAAGMLGWMGARPSRKETNPMDFPTDVQSDRWMF